MDIVALFCDIDDFCLPFVPLWHQHLLAHGSRSRQRETTLAVSEVRTSEVAFHESGSRTFKEFSLRYVTPPLRWAFPRLVSYTRFVELMQQALVPLCAYLQTRKGQSEGSAFMDSTLLAVCHPQRSAGHRVFAGLAGWGKNAFGWC